MEKKKKRKKKVMSFLNNFQYVFTANMSRRRFWMIDFLFPHAPSGLALREAVDKAFLDDKKIMDFGCGDKAQSLTDLRNEGVDNLYGIDLKPPVKITGVNVIKSDILNSGLEDNFIDGVIYSSYVLAHLSPEDQLKALYEIDRITAPGATGFIGPFIPKYLLNSPFSEKFPKYKNPLVGFIAEMNAKGEGTWMLHKNIIFTSNYRTNRFDEAYYRSTIPFFSLYILVGRSLIRRVIPSIRVKKDHKVRLPFEYFVTFTKD